jgi:hypothetical protein
LYSDRPGLSEEDFNEDLLEEEPIDLEDCDVKLAVPLVFGIGAAITVAEARRTRPTVAVETLTILKIVRSVRLEGRREDFFF